MSRGNFWTPFWLPAEPLVRQVDARGGFRACGPVSTTLVGTYLAARQTGRLTVWAADILAVEVLGEHPMMVWGDEWLYGPQNVALRPLDELAQRRDRATATVTHRTNCRPGWGPCRRRHEHTSPRRAG